MTKNQRTPSPESLMPPRGLLKIITYNLWHGLNGKGFFKFGELEPRHRRQERFLWQLKQLKNLDADIIFLQEVNPLYTKAEILSRELNMDYIAQYDQAGLRVLRWGLPINLQTGLLILVKRNFNLRRVAGVKLSGGFGFCSKTLSWQMAEFRYALLGSIQWQSERFTLANIHLHHGANWTKELSSELTKSSLAKSLTEDVSQLQRQIERSELRRRQEIQRLVNRLNEPSIICGDLNVEPNDDLLKLLPNHRDVFGDTKVVTWSERQNRENHLLTKNLALPVNFSVFHDPGAVEKVLRDHDARARRIDYILLPETLTAHSKSLVFDEVVDGLIGSDHFGLWAELKKSKHSM